MPITPDIEAIHRRICRLHSTTWANALLFVGPQGEWEVIREGKDRPRCGRYEQAGLFVGAYQADVGFDQLREDVEAHLHELSG